MTDTNHSEVISNSLISLERYIASEKFSGFDPYDALNSRYFNYLSNKFINLFATQSLVYLPVNLRYLLKIDKGINPKAIGLLLQAYCKLYNIGLIENGHFRVICNQLVELLIQTCSRGYSGYCWGFNFDWQDLTHYSNKNKPTIVITSYIGNAFLDLFEITNNKKYLDISTSCCEFIINDLNISTFDNGICFSYTPYDDFVVHNANLLGASLLARTYSITKNNSFVDYSRSAVDFSISQQKSNGLWAYSYNLKNQKERFQTDFHQGFILDSLCDFIRFTKPDDDKYYRILSHGAEFYKDGQFDKAGKSKWRLPRSWPIDIHNQAQGIISFCKLYQLFHDEKFLKQSEQICLWTIKNMQDKRGFFYYQMWPFFTNKIAYIRWGQAWMLLALATFLSSSEALRDD